MTIIDVKRQARKAAMMMISQLDEKFPDVDIINALGVVFPQYWQEPNCVELFPLHMEVLAKFYCELRTVVPDPTAENSEPKVIEILSRRELESQVSCFKSTMISSSISTMQSEAVQDGKGNPLTLLWKKLAASNYTKQYLSEWFKVAEIAVITVIGSVEDERMFSTLGWLKSKVRNRLNAHLDCTLRLYSQPWWGVSTFPYKAAVDHWEKVTTRRGTGRGR
jgi:hypothetical protein